MSAAARVSPWSFGALVGMTGALFLYGAAFGSAPVWAGLVLLVVWVVLLTAVLRWFHTRPRLTALMPVLAVAIWFGALVGGARLLGW